MHDIKSLTIRSNEKQAILLNCANIDKRKFKYSKNFIKQITWFSNGKQILEEDENYLIKENKLFILNLNGSANFTCKLRNNPNIIQTFNLTLIKEDSLEKNELTNLLKEWKKEIGNFNKNFDQCT